MSETGGASPTRPHGIGIVGTGVIAATHAEAIAAIPGARLVAVNRRGARARPSFAGSRGCAVEPSLDALLAREISTSCRYACRAACTPRWASRSPRPASTWSWRSRSTSAWPPPTAFIDAVDAAGVAMTVISQHRFDPGLVELRGLIDDGALGRLVLGEASTKWYRSQGYYDSGPWRGTWALDGGSLMNQGIHYVDLLRWTMGPVIEVSAVYATEDHQVEVEDTALAVLRFISGAVGTIVSSTAVFPGFAQRLEVSGTGGTVVVEDGEIVRSAFTSDSPDPGLRGTRLPRPPSAEGAAANAAALGVASHAAQIADLLAAVEQGREPSVTGRNGRDVLEVVLAVYQSAREGRPVVLLDATQAGRGRGRDGPRP